MWSILTTASDRKEVAAVQRITAQLLAGLARADSGAIIKVLRL